MPEPVVGSDRSHPGAERPVSHPAGGDLDALLGGVDGRDAHKPVRRLELVGLVLGDDLLAVPVGPHDAVGLGLLDLVLQQLADRFVVADQRLVCNQRREKDERLMLLAREAGGVLGGALGHEQGTLHAAAGDDRDPHGKHEARNQSPILPESKYAHVSHVASSGPGAGYLTCVVL